MERINAKIGDIYSVIIDNNKKKYFQLIAFDLTQLNSDVIRAFKSSYHVDENPDKERIINDEIDFYVHCVVKLGLKMNIWEKIGNIAEIGDVKDILFRDTNDYGSNVGEKSIEISTNWYVWHINDKAFTRVGKLEGENQKAYIGIVINPLGILELFKGFKYPVEYPSYK